MEEEKEYTLEQAENSLKVIRDVYVKFTDEITKKAINKEEINKSELSHQKLLKSQYEQTNRIYANMVKNKSKGGDTLSDLLKQMKQWTSTLAPLHQNIK
jgi:conjugal transfer/entry exclusion protein